MRGVLSDYNILVHLFNKQNIFAYHFTILEFKLYATLCYIMLHCAVMCPCRAVSCCAMLCRDMLCCTVLDHAVPALAAGRAATAPRRSTRRAPSLALEIRAVDRSSWWV